MGNEPLVGRDKSFYEQLNIIIKDKIEEKKEFDKKFFYVISSFFAFSVLLLQFIKEPIFISYLLIAWGFNLLALISHLISYLLAVKTHNEKMKKYISMERNDDNERNKNLKLLIGIDKFIWVKITMRTEIFSYICFVLATISFLIFSYLNLV